MTASTVNGHWFTSTNKEYHERPIRVGIGLQCVAATETIAATSSDEINDRVNMLPIPQGAKILAIYYEVADLDSDNAVEADIVCAETTDGTLTETDLNSPSQFGRAAATGWLLPDAGDVWLHEVGVCDDGIAIIRFKVTTAGTSADAGALSLVCWYY